MELSLLLLCKTSSGPERLWAWSRDTCRLSCSDLHRLSPRPGLWGLKFPESSLGIRHRSVDDDGRQTGCRSGTGDLRGSLGICEAGGGHQTEFSFFLPGPWWTDQKILLPQMQKF